MRINSINPIQSYNRISFQSSNKPQARLDERTRDLLITEGLLKSEMTTGVPKHSKEAMYDVLKDCYELSKRRFPGQKVSVFFNVRQKKNVKSHVEYVIGVGVNSQANEGLSRSEGELPGYLECRNADFYHVKTLYSYSGEKLNYESIRKEVLGDLAKSIEDHKNKPVQEEEPRQKENFFKKLFNKIFKK